MSRSWLSLRMMGPGVARGPILPVALGLSIAAAYFVWTVIDGPPFVVPLTDFGRDLVAAQATLAGVSPYQTVRDLAVHLPGDWTISPLAADHWVAHPPVAIAVGRVLLTSVGVAAAEVVVGLGSWFGIGFSATWLGLFVASRHSAWHGLAVAAAFALSFGLAPDIFYLHGASIAAALLIWVLNLDQTARRSLGVVVLGLVVGWKPWLAPVAAFLPGRVSVLRDISLAGTVALSSNLISVLWIGGLPLLSDWLGTALTSNVAQVQDWGINVSILGGLLPTILSAGVMVAVTLICLRATRVVPREQWPLLAVLSIVTASPLVWPQYWLALTPLVVFGFRRTSHASLMAVLLLTSVVLGGLSLDIGQICVVVAAALIAWEVLQSSVDDHFANNPPAPGWWALKYRDLLKSRPMSTD